MAKQFDYEVKTTIRLNMHNPDHVLINNVIQNLDPKIFKSKNQFILDACKFYIDNYGSETFIAKKKDNERAEYIRSADIEDIKTEVIEAAINEAKAEIVTLALRRVNNGGMANILDYIPKDIALLPNTSGARNADEAIRIARLSKELCGSDLVKIEIMRDSKYLLPDNYETIKATEVLAKEGFTVMPYMYPDLNVARDLVNAGASCVMPLGAPIGSNKGLCTKEFIQILIDEIDLPIIVDAGIGRPSQACEAMEMGATAIMANTAIAIAGDVVRMAKAFNYAIEAGRLAYEAKLGRVKAQGASASSPLTGFLQD